MSVELLEAGRLRLVEVAAPPMSAEQRAAMNRAWDEAVEVNPSFFDGPLAVCAGLDREPSGELVVSWSRTTYRYLALRRVPGATARRSLFVSVMQPTDDGRVLVGRMSSSTAAPGHWQLPGGSIEPPTGRTPLDEAALRRHAAVELAEETGIDTPAEDLTRRLVIHRSDGQIGVHYLAPSRPASQLHERFAALVAEETAQGHDPEFDRIALIGSPAELADLAGPHVVYLEPLVRYHMDSRLLDGLQDPRPR
ncbi:NUDIX hydrolase [Streptomyces fulvoviolaceus]|uniref:NUDIX hydrolase n=1 Tax=Streptomyces fulvoviolaceus TaxID=285535 RepID=UPI0021BF78C9|nr:NUDIX domain-containing protein [Streptomyces fulvoviolaceus]MCT9082774.1 NUDIX domain-containing protein [Streptomyces fulvoviolaceus]